MRIFCAVRCLLYRLGLLLGVLGAVSPAATLEQMSLDELIEKSTSIVQGRTTSIRAVQNGALIYTLHRFEIREQWKGEPASAVEIALPGGSVGGVQQRFGGVPQLEPSREFVVFLWKGPSGRTQITGLSQGIFEVIQRDTDAEVFLRRKPNADVILAPGTGEVLQNTTVEIALADLVARIRHVLAGGPPAP